MIKEYITIPKLLFEGNRENILSYPLYEIIHRNSKGYLIGDTNYGKQDLTLATKVASSVQASRMLKDNYEGWEKPKDMTIVIKNADMKFLNDDIEIHIELMGDIE